MERVQAFYLSLYITVKVPMKRNSKYLIRKSFQNDEEWHLFYCDSTLGSRVIQDFD